MTTEASICWRCGEAMTGGLIHACPAVETTHGSAALRAIEGAAIARVLAELTDALRQNRDLVKGGPKVWREGFRDGIECAMREVEVLATKEPKP